jgi:translation initiation factor IF-3
VPQVRVIGEGGEQLGVLPIQQALQRAMDVGLDLVEVAPNAEPPVCRIMDYGKFKYEKAKKAKEARKKQHVVHLKEIKLHPKTEEHDYNFKMKHARDFLMRGDRVKATVVFRGREITHIEFGRQILERFDKDIADLAMIELSCKMEGRNMVSMYVPDRAKIRDAQRKIDQEKKRQEAEAAAAAQAAAPAAPAQEKPAA